MHDDHKLLFRYNRGYGPSYDPSKNAADYCRHHSGAAVICVQGLVLFHQKSIGFTGFINIKCYSVSFCYNVKPPHREKDVSDDINIECRPPITAG